MQTNVSCSYYLISVLFVHELKWQPERASCVYPHFNLQPRGRPHPQGQPQGRPQRVHSPESHLEEEGPTSSESKTVRLGFSFHLPLVLPGWNHIPT